MPSRYTSEKITTGILPHPSNPPAVICAAGHPTRTEIFGVHRLDAGTDAVEPVREDGSRARSAVGEGSHGGQGRIDVGW